MCGGCNPLKDQDESQGQQTPLPSSQPSPTEETFRDKPVKPTTMLPWPEDQRIARQTWIHRWYQRFTYAYMNRVLDIGAKQERKNDGTFLSQEDLYSVPSSMESHHLSELFL